MSYEKLDKIAISVKSHRLLKKLLEENHVLKEIMYNSKNETEALIGVKEWILKGLKDKPELIKKYNAKRIIDLKSLEWKDYAAIRLLDYIEHAGAAYEDLNLKGKLAVSNPIKMIWLAVTYGAGGAKPYFFEDMLHLFRQFTGKQKKQEVSKDKIKKWMRRYPSGLDPRIVKLREENRDRIIKVFIDKIDRGKISDPKYKFTPDMTQEDKYKAMRKWWKEDNFHLKFAIRSPKLLNEMSDFSIDPDTMKILYHAEKAGIPFFVNPYYLSLLHVRRPYFAIGAEMAIRDYIIYNKDLVKEFGEIVAWEKEDEVEPGKPNAAGWLLPYHNNIHRRYPEVAIMIPDSMGRACAGLCSTCQRMFDFQRGLLNFNLDKLKPKVTWNEKLKKMMTFFEQDSQLRDILITGGDALMSSNRTLKKILDEVYEMALRKKKSNEKRKNGEKYAELVRIRLGTRLPVYLPQRITPELIEILTEFKKKASKIGIKQFVIQTHFQSPMEITPKAKKAVEGFISAGWIVTNQLVFTTAASRRGHTAKLRKVLNEIGVLPYYTFTVKGYMENRYHFSTSARIVQEEIEEKKIGEIPKKYFEKIKILSETPEKIINNLEELKDELDIPFLSTDRNVLNLPGVGKSMTFKVIGITRYGRRILQFDHDSTRSHSPIIDKMGKVVIIESKSVSEYLKQLEDMGEDIKEYEDVYGYSLGETEPRMSIYEYPEYDFDITKELTNIDI